MRFAFLIFAHKHRCRTRPNAWRPYQKVGYLTPGVLVLNELHVARSFVACTQIWYSFLLVGVNQTDGSIWQNETSPIASELCVQQIGL